MLIYTVEVSYNNYDPLGLQVALPDFESANLSAEDFANRHNYDFNAVVVKEWFDGEATVVKRITGGKTSSW